MIFSKRKIRKRARREKDREQKSIEGIQKQSFEKKKKRKSFFKKVNKKYRKAISNRKG